MISKETFVKAFKLIKAQKKIDDEFSKALNLVGNGHFVYGCDNHYLEALLVVLKEAMNDVGNYIDWWMYETSDYLVWDEDEGLKWDLRSPEALYDFLSNDCTRK